MKLLIKLGILWLVIFTWKVYLCWCHPDTFVEVWANMFSLSLFFLHEKIVACASHQSRGNEFVFVVLAKHAKPLLEQINLTQLLFINIVELTISISCYVVSLHNTQCRCVWWPNRMSQNSAIDDLVLQFGSYKIFILI